MRWQFYNSKWNGGYGGKKWGIVTDCLVRFVFGEFYAEMMLDTVWTLSHNNGPIFNKGIFTSAIARYSCCGSLMCSGRARSRRRCSTTRRSPPYVDARPARDDDAAAGDVPGSGKDHVDWYVVKALGGLGNYEADKVQQTAEARHVAPRRRGGEAGGREGQARRGEGGRAEGRVENTHFVVMPELAVKKFEMERVDG